MGDFYDNLAYDEQVVAEKLGMYETDDINTNVKLALMQEELARSQRQVASMKKTKPVREHFTGGCDGMSNKQKHHSKPHSPLEEISLLDNKNLLILLVVILAVFCIVQYFSYKTEVREIMELVHMLMRKQLLEHVTHPHTGQPMTMQMQQVPMQMQPMQAQPVPQPVQVQPQPVPQPVQSQA